MTRRYKKVSDDQRRDLIKSISSGRTIKESASDLNIPYENAKAIIRVFNSENRTEKQIKRSRKTKLDIKKP